MSLSVFVQSASSLPNVDRFSKSDPMCVITLQGRQGPSLPVCTHEQNYSAWIVRSVLGTVSMAVSAMWILLFAEQSRSEARKGTRVGKVLKEAEYFCPCRLPMQSIQCSTHSHALTANHMAVHVVHVSTCSIIVCMLCIQRSAVSSCVIVANVLRFLLHVRVDNG